MCIEPVSADNPDPCAGKGGCSDLCRVNDADNTAQCYCDSYRRVLKADGKTCVGMYCCCNSSCPVLKARNSTRFGSRATRFKAIDLAIHEFCGSIDWSSIVH